MLVAAYSYPQATQVIHNYVYTGYPQVNSNVYTDLSTWALGCENGRLRGFQLTLYIGIKK